MKIGIAGASGRVGQLLIKELRSGAYEAELSAALMRAPIGDEPYPTTQTADELFTMSDAVIDFSVPEATLHHAKIAAQSGKILVIGTTGLTSDQEADLEKAAQTAPIVYAANMSVGVNLLMALVEQAAARLNQDWDIEIFEAHHKHKVDSPSGTALALGHAAANGRGKPLDDIAEYARHGIQEPREKGKIGFSVARGGDVVGEHDVTFYAEGERLTLSHKATNRSLFAKGAIRAALWAKDVKPGLYSMRDVLDI
jgi:4-hydroxy-tetrahydrodipicolinate reductase